MIRTSGREALVSLAGAELCVTLEPGVVARPNETLSLQVQAVGAPAQLAEHADEIGQMISSIRQDGTAR